MFYNEEMSRYFNLLEEEINNEKSIFKEKILIRNYCLFRLMYYSAIKKEEIVNLLICNIEESTVSYNGCLLRIIDTKLNSLIRQHVYINKPSKYLFESGNGQKLSLKTIERIINQTFVKLGVCYNSSLELTELRINELRENKLLCDKEILYWLGYRNNLTNTINEDMLYGKIK